MSHNQGLPFEDRLKEKQRVTNQEGSLELQKRCHKRRNAVPAKQARTVPIPSIYPCGFGRFAVRELEF